MVGDKELLEYLSENVNMGLEALETLSKDLEKTDNKIRSNVLKALQEYRKFYKECKNSIKGISVDIPKRGLVSTLMVKMGSKREFMKDNSDSKIAETLIQGYQMGIIDIDKKLNMYKSDASKDTIKLAEKYRSMMHRCIDSIKGFL